MRFCMNQVKKSIIDKKYWLFALQIAGDFGITIAIPVVLFAYIGKQLDLLWGTGPRLLILGFIIAALISGAMIYRKAKRYGKEYQKLVNQEIGKSEN